jgi:glycine cleavage system H protein
MADATYPEELRYHEAHDWAFIDGNIATFGITWHAQDALGDVVFFDPPEINSQVRSGASYGELESVKAVSDVISPLDGEVIEVNEAVVSTPESINDDPYAAWLIRVRLTAPEQVASLLDSAAYQALIG